MPSQSTDLQAPNRTTPIVTRHILNGSCGAVMLDALDGEDGPA
jgi:hypothetical protein